MTRYRTSSSLAIAVSVSLVVSSLTARAQDPCLQALTPIAPGTNVGFISTGDMDGDGDLDVVVAPIGSQTGGSGVYRNAGNGTFTLIAQPVPGTVGGRLIDMDGDGDLDVVSTEFFASTISVRLNQGAGTLGPAVSYLTGPFPSGLASGDLDGDGDVDLVTANTNALSLSVHFNAGDGSIAAHVTVPGGTPDGGATLNTGAAVGDLDGDGDLDLVWAIDKSGAFEGANQSRLCVRHNLGGGVFGAILSTPLPGEITGPTLADFNGDGFLDAVSTNRIPDTTSVLLNSGAGTLLLPTTYATNGYSSHACADLDRDGDQDIVVGLFGGAIRWMLNDGSGSFTVDPTVLLPGTNGSVTLGNIVGDSKPEFLTSGTATGVLIYRNCQTVGTRYCFGDGSSGACPCQNSGIADHGCANIVYASGAQLSASGIASVSSDSLKLTSEGLSGAQSWYFQATGQDAVPFGRGILCVAGTLLRVGQKAVVGGSSTNPSGVDFPLSVKGAIPPAGGTRYYQVSYRHANPVCTPAPVSNTNRTNGLAIVWTP